MSLPPRLLRHRASLVALAAAAAIAGYVIAAPARADDGKRRELVDAINRLLENISGELSDVPRDSSDSDLVRTIDYAAQIASEAEELKSHAGDDSEAQRMKDYPSYASRYQDAARYLREMKNQQRRNDTAQRACEDKSRELAERMRVFTDSPDPRGFDEIPRLARDLGRTGKDALEQAERLRYELANFYDRVDDFSDSDGKWSAVRSNLHAAGKVMLEYVQQQQEQLKKDDTCGNLAREERNPRVEEAMRKLSEGKKGIELMYEAMDRQLGEIAGSLDRLEGDSSDSDISSAESKLGDLERNLDQLDRIRGNDGEARRRVEAWRNNARSAREATKQLRALKLAQYAADRAPEKCVESTKRVNEVVDRMLSNSKEASVSKLEALGRSIAEPIKAGLAKTDEQHSVMERALSDAQRFDPSEGRWREVTDRNRASAATMFDYWKRAREAAHTACDDLAKGEQSAVVRAGVEKVKSGASGQIDLFRKDVLVWNSDADSLFQMDCTELEQIWLALCGSDEERNEAPDRDEARATARDIGNRMKGHVDPMLVRYADLKKRGDALIDAEETKAVATALVASMDEKFAKFARIQSGGALRGSDHPMSQYAAEYGKQMHDDYGKRFKCAVYDQPYGSSSDGRPDCVMPDGECMILEFKPDTRKAKSDGARQVARYQGTVTAYYQQRIDAKAGDDSSEQGGITTAVEKKCMSGPRVVFATKVEPYPLCEKKFECTR